MYPENAYLLFAHYGITERDDIPKRIEKASRISYLDFCRRVSFQKGMAVAERDKLQKKTDRLLADRIPGLLQSAKDAENGKEVFDKLHREICNDIQQLYSCTGGLSYGVVQRWLNLTLMNLVVIGSNLVDEQFPVLKARKYFHVPIDQYLLEVATCKTNRFVNGLQLKSAPLRHGKEESYQMEWFRPGETQPYEYWEYPEYMEFQIAVRNKLADGESRFHYQDTLDWAFSAYIEGKQARYKS